MASINWMKATTQKAGGMKKHLGQVQRENSNHSNEHINNALSHLNYAIGCSDYPEALNQMKARTKAVDKIMPPKRVRKDRVTCCFLELPCPRAITEQGKSDEFFRCAHEIYKKFFGGENVHGTFVHKDEVHEYIGKDGATHMSCEHSHTLISAYTAEQGINGKAFETRAKIKTLNTLMDEMCVKEYGIHLNTGDTPQQKSVETLKMESDARQEASRIVSKAVEEAKALGDTIIPLKGEYEALKAYTSEANKIYTDHPEIKTIKKGLLHNKDYVLVPKKTWDGKQISYRQEECNKKAAAALDKRIQEFKSTATGENIDKLKKKIDKLEIDNNQLKNKNFELSLKVSRANNKSEQVKEQLLKRITSVLEKLPPETANAFVKEWQCQQQQAQQKQHSYEQEL